MEELFCEEDRRKWRIGEKFVPFERRFAKGMISFAAGHLYNLWTYRAGGIRKVEIRCGGMDWPPTAREYTCLACRPLHKKVFLIDGTLPELPHPPCVGYYNCRCRFSAVFDDERFSAKE
jgi:hypothetical protein